MGELCVEEGETSNDHHILSMDTWGTVCKYCCHDNPGRHEAGTDLLGIGPADSPERLRKAS